MFKFSSKDLLSFTIIKMFKLITYQFTVTEEVNTITLEWSSILGPREPGDRVTLDRGGDAKLLALVNGHVTHRTSEGGGGPLHAFLGPRLDGHGGIGSAIDLMKSETEVRSSLSTCVQIRQHLLRSFRDCRFGLLFFGKECMV